MLLGEQQSRRARPGCTQAEDPRPLSADWRVLMQVESGPTDFVILEAVPIQLVHMNQWQTLGC